jgi:hypothetical protein
MFGETFESLLTSLRSLRNETREGRRGLTDRRLSTQPSSREGHARTSNETCRDYSLSTTPDCQGSNQSKMMLPITGRDVLGRAVHSPYHTGAFKRSSTCFALSPRTSRLTSPRIAPYLRSPPGTGMRCLWNVVDAAQVVATLYSVPGTAKHHGATPLSICIRPSAPWTEALCSCHGSSQLRPTLFRTRRHYRCSARAQRPGRHDGDDGLSEAAKPSTLSTTLRVTGRYPISNRVPESVRFMG